MLKPLIISVVRDWAMYEKCIAGNPFCANCEKRPVDNSVENETIPRRYNQVLDSLDLSVPRWLVFCHEDFEINEEWTDVLSMLDRNVIYGPVGARYVNKFSWRINVEPCGSVIQLDRDGESEIQVGRLVDLAVVDTLDCLCVIVNTFLINRFHLRWDEALSFDLYAEDFSIAAFERFGIVTRNVLIKSHHWSNSIPSKRFFSQLAYLNRKWPHVSYASTCSFCVGGKRGWVWMMAKLKTSRTICSLYYLARKFFGVSH